MQSLGHTYMQAGQVQGPRGGPTELVRRILGFTKPRKFGSKFVSLRLGAEKSFYYLASGEIFKSGVSYLSTSVTKLWSAAFIHKERLALPALLG